MNQQEDEFITGCWVVLLVFLITLIAVMSMTEYAHYLAYELLLKR